MVHLHRSIYNATITHNPLSFLQWRVDTQNVISWIQFSVAGEDVLSITPGHHFKYNKTLLTDFTSPTWFE